MRRGDHATHVIAELVRELESHPDDSDNREENATATHLIEHDIDKFEAALNKEPNHDSDDSEFATRYLSSAFSTSIVESPIKSQNSGDKFCTGKPLVHKSSPRGLLTDDNLCTTAVAWCAQKSGRFKTEVLSTLKKGSDPGASSATTPRRSAKEKRFLHNFRERARTVALTDAQRRAGIVKILPRIRKRRI